MLTNPSPTVHIRGDALGRSYTPEPVARAIVTWLEYRYAPTSVLEPCVGGGAFARAARAAWPHALVVGRDIDAGAPGASDCDQFELGDARDVAGVFDLSVTNPPFGKAVGADVTRQIVEASMTVARVTAMLVPLDYVAQVRWMPLVQRCAWVCPLSPRPFAHERGMVLLVWDAAREETRPSRTTTFAPLVWRS